LEIVVREKIDNIRPCLNKLLNYYKEFIGLDLFVWLIAELIKKLYKNLGPKKIIEIFFDYIEFCTIMSYKRCNLYFFFEIAFVNTFVNESPPVIKYDKEKHQLFAKIVEDLKHLFSKESIFHYF
jgi:hypothetical protein